MRVIRMLGGRDAGGAAAASAQDIAGLEDCTKTQGLDQRTGCLQSNVNFLQRTMTRNALEAHRRLQAAEAEIVGAEDGARGLAQAGGRAARGEDRRREGRRREKGRGAKTDEKKKNERGRSRRGAPPARVPREPVLRPKHATAYRPLPPQGAPSLAAAIP